MNQFYFTLHPLQWMFNGDAEQVFRALKLWDGKYIISWIPKEGGTIELVYTEEEVKKELKLGNWIIKEEIGELL